MMTPWRHTAESAAATLRPLHFLLVDDDEMCLFIHRRVLELSGCSDTISTACNGRKALELLSHSIDGARPLPDVILLDLDMPLMNGLAFLEAFRALDFPDKERISVVVLTSSVSDDDRHHVNALGAADYLVKPFTHDSLRRILATLPDTSLSGD